MKWLLHFLKGIPVKLHWHANDFLTRNPALLEKLGLTLTIVDLFGTPGDTLLCATVCRELKRRFPFLKVNCTTPNPSLLKLDPNIESLNGPKTFCFLNFSYLGILDSKDATTNVLKPVMDHLGLKDYRYRARVYLSEDEIEFGKKQVGGMRRPLITINAMSREMMKVWPLENWRILVGNLVECADVVQLGDATEPTFEGVLHLAGKLSMRESMAVLAQADLHIGPDSFLMHAANGVNVPSVIIYGGSRPPGCLAYSENTSLYVDIECSPCWLHDSRGDRCPYEMKCMQMITPQMVLAAVHARLSNARLRSS